jgi:hypothetical protein
VVVPWPSQQQEGMRHLTWARSPRLVTSITQNVALPYTSPAPPPPEAFTSFEHRSCKFQSTLEETLTFNNPYQTGGTLFKEALFPKV